MPMNSGLGALGAGLRRADGRQIDAARGAVDQRNAIEEEGGGERSQKEVFERRFVGALIVAQISGQHVARDGRDFEADEDDDQLDWPSP